MSIADDNRNRDVFLRIKGKPGTYYVPSLGLTARAEEISPLSVRGSYKTILNNRGPVKWLLTRIMIEPDARYREFPDPARVDLGKIELRDAEARWRHPPQYDVLSLMDAALGVRALQRIMSESAPLGTTQMLVAGLAHLMSVGDLELCPIVLDWHGRDLDAKLVYDRDDDLTVQLFGWKLAIV